MSEPAPRRIRRAARILLLAEDDTLLLFRFTPPDRRPFWATPGGECDPDEDYGEGARRELFEETGMRHDPGQPIAHRQVDIVTLEGEPVTAQEAMFLVRVRDQAIETTGHTALEQRIMQSHRWFTRSELADWHETIYPENILDYLTQGQAP